MASKQDQKCRLCLTPGLFHMNLFTTSHNAILAIREIFQCEVDEYDQLPNYICVDCWCLLQQFHEFYRNVIAAQNFFLLHAEPAIKVEQPDEPVPMNSYAEDFVCEPEHDAAYDTEIQNEHSQSNNLLHTDYTPFTVIHNHIETTDFDSNGFNSMDDTNSNYPNSFQSFNHSKKFERSTPLKRKRGRPRKIRIKEEFAKIAMPKRKRGRPRKERDPADMLRNDSSRGMDDYSTIDDSENPLNRPVVETVKRKRGRPRKTPKQADTTRDFRICCS